MNNNPIGVFDSGIGGLTVVKEILKELPNEKIIYLGDTARVPYGTRGKEVIKKFALELTNFLLKKQVKMLVVACNTISSICLEDIAKACQIPVLGVIDSAVLEAINTTKNNSVGVIGTRATISSLVYEKALKSINPKLTITVQACPLFVPLAEEGLINGKATELIAEKYLEKFKNPKVNKSSFKIDTLILGCTHYPVLKQVVQKVVGKKVKLIDSAKPTARKLKQILNENNLINKGEKQDCEFYVTDDPERVYTVAASFFGKKLNGKLKKVMLHET